MTHHPIIYTSNQDDLYQIHHPDVGAVIWQRPIPDAVQAFLDWLPVDASYSLLTDPLLPGDEHNKFIGKLSTDATEQAWGAMVDELVKMTSLYRHITGAHKVASFFVNQAPTGRESEDVTEKFHTDGNGISIRMITTYRGAATQYLTDPICNRTLRLSKPSLEKGEYDPAKIIKLQVGDVIFLKGAEYGPNTRPDDPLVYHRAPYITQPGTGRLKLMVQGMAYDINDFARNRTNNCITSRKPSP